VQPPSSLLLEDKVQPPLGILYLSAWLRKHGHEVSIVDLAGVENWHKHIMLVDWQKIVNADIIGFTATTPQANISQKIMKFIKEIIRKDIGVKKRYVIGGIHYTSLVYANEMDFLEKDGFDSYCIGEGYNAVTKMAEDFPNLKRMYAEPILKDVNELPFAARDLIDIKSYKYKLGDVPTTTYYTQYGCYYECLSADTFITMGDTTKVRLEEIRIGDIIQSANGKKSKVTAKQKTFLKKQSWEVELETGEKIIGSAKHPIMTKRGWVEISQLTDKDEILTENA
jgi:B12 binding protein